MLNRQSSPATRPAEHLVRSLTAFNYITQWKNNKKKISKNQKQNKVKLKHTQKKKQTHRKTEVFGVL